jgi:hypothetical protein
MARGVVAAVILLAIIGFVTLAGIGATSSASQQAATPVDVTNESFTAPAEGATYTVANRSDSGLNWSDTVTVYSDGGQLKQAGTDYEWFPGNGTLLVVNGSTLADDSDAQISYHYQNQSATTARAVRYIATNIDLLTPLVVVVGVLVVVLGVIKMGG